MSASLNKNKESWVKKNYVFDPSLNLLESVVLGDLVTVGLLILDYRILF